MEHNTLYPVGGSAVLEHRSSADGWEPERDGQRFVACLVELQVGEHALSP